jgi:hypothetical protein
VHVARAAEQGRCASQVCVLQAHAQQDKHVVQVPVLIQQLRSSTVVRAAQSA